MISALIEFEKFEKSDFVLRSRRLSFLVNDQLNYCEISWFISK